MTWVKICGITNVQDALTAVDAGADALGFVFYEKSPRRVSPETACEIVEKLPSKIERVGVFVDESAERMLEVAQQAGLSAVQAHMGFAEPGRVQDLLLLNENATTYKVIAVMAASELGREGLFLLGTARRMFYALMLDSVSTAMPGGTGKTFDWSKARGMIESLGVTLPIIVAGGLTDLNVGEAMRIFQPWGVDVSSGVESSPGEKDPNKVRAFVAAVRQAERLV
ncbi:MAG: phosphoribosylanthranilate isomerase [Terriglobales bacterium]